MNQSTPNKKPVVFSTLILAMLLSIFVYSFIVGADLGWASLYPTFFQNILDFSWSGQFNLDFSFYLTLSSLWIMWRDKFSFPSIVVGVIAAFLGMMAFGIYLLYALWRSKGNMRKMLLGINE